MATINIILQITGERPQILGGGRRARTPDVRRSPEWLGNCIQPGRASKM